MKLEIYRERIERKAVEEPIRLMLRSNKDMGSIEVVAVDKNGVVLGRGNLIIFRADGTIDRCRCVQEDLNFKLDGDGQIKMRN